MNIQKIGIAGSGIMGFGIAIVALQSGFDVILYDITDEVLQKALQKIHSYFDTSVSKGKITIEQKDTWISKLTLTSQIDELIADYIIEAIPENLEWKQDLFQKLESINSEKAYLASNTSTIPITQIANCLKTPEKMIGFHFFNPASLMKLVEIIPGEKTSSETINVTVELAKVMKKEGVIVKDSPGFIVNRVARHFYLESLMIMQENVADYQTIDLLMKNVGFKMGPFELMDLIGIETNHSVTKSLFQSYFYEPRFRPSVIQQKKVDAGLFGRKTKQGFYSYKD